MGWGFKRKEKPDIELEKKIAYLESLKDCAENRRSTKEIIEKIQKLEAEMLKLDREEYSFKTIEEKIKVLKWVLGE